MGGTTLGFLRGIASSAGRCGLAGQLGRLGVLEPLELLGLSRARGVLEPLELLGLSRARGVGEPNSVATAVYWRRRFIVLVVGLVVLGLAAWGLSSAIAVRAQLRAPARHGHHLGNSSSNGAGVSGAGVSGAGVSGGQASGRGTILPAFCARSEIVLSIFSGQTQYGRRQWPGFDLNIVSTQRTGCSFNVGSAHLILVIKEGPSRIWSSADCAKGTTGLITELRRGVPTVVPVTWNRHTSSPGCVGPSREVPPGVYTAFTTDNGVKSQSVTFRLS